MSSVPTDLLPALEALPLFPLGQVVLFPGMLLALHVFEPRYVAMVREVMKTHRCIAPVLVDSSAANPMGSPPFRPIAGVGTIMELIELPGGRFNIVLRGRARVRLEELTFEPPFRRARATILSTEKVRVADGDLAALHHAAGAFTGLIKRRNPDFSLTLPKNAEPEVIADSLAHQLVLHAHTRQAILEAVDPRERVRLVTETLTIQFATLSGFDQNASN